MKAYRGSEGTEPMSVFRVELSNPCMKQELWMSEAYVRKLNRQYAARKRYRSKYTHTMRSLRRRFHLLRRHSIKGISFRFWVRHHADTFRDSASPKVRSILGLQ